MIELETTYLKSPPVDSDTLREKVYLYIQYCGDSGVTDNELYDAFPSRLQGTVRARRIELVRGCKVTDKGKDANGRTIWVAM